MKKQQSGYATQGLIVLLVIGTMVGSWFTHVFTCIADKEWGFLIAGAIFFPVAIIHGIGIWLGAF